MASRVAIARGPLAMSVLSVISSVSALAGTFSLVVSRDVADQFLIDEVRGRQIDCDREVETVETPFMSLRNSGRQHDLGELVHATDLLGEGQERVGVEQT